MVEKDTNPQSPPAAPPEVDGPDYDAQSVVELDPLRVPGGFVSEDMGTGWSQRSGTQVRQFAADGVIESEDMGTGWGAKAGGPPVDSASRTEGNNTDES